MFYSILNVHPFQTRVTEKFMCSLLAEMTDSFVQSSMDTEISESVADVVAVVESKTEDTAKAKSVKARKKK